jgi:hypothetical protein
MIPPTASHKISGLIDAGAKPTEGEESLLAATRTYDAGISSSNRTHFTSVHKNFHFKAEVSLSFVTKNVSGGARTTLF